MVKEVGFVDPRLVSYNKITIQNADVENKIGHIDFYSATYRLFKIKNLDVIWWTPCIIILKRVLLPYRIEMGSLEDILQMK